MKKIRVISIIITILIMAVIFFFSSQPADESTIVSTGITRRIAEFVASLHVFKGADAELLTELLHNFIRKCAHFSEYLILGISMSVTFRLHKVKPWYIAFMFVVACCMLYAASDEFHQLFVSGRSAKITDVLIDTSGAATGTAMFLALRRLIFEGLKKKGR